MTAILAFYSVPAADALLLSLSIGFITMVGPLPGGVLWLMAIRTAIGREPRPDPPLS